jgi:hypothetical protein
VSDPTAVATQFCHRYIGYQPQRLGDVTELIGRMSRRPNETGQLLPDA